LAIFKKLVTSGSAAQLASLQLDTALGVLYGGTGLQASSASGFLVGTGASTYTTVGSNGTGRVLRETGAQGIIASGSFSGSFIGSGAGLTGVTADSTFRVSGSNDGYNFNTATDTLLFTTASNHGFDLSSSFNSTLKRIVLTTPQDLRSTANPTFNNGQFNGNVNIVGDLTVLGSVVQLQITNLNIEDRFILLNSGSATGDGGFVVSSGSGGNGVAFGYDESTSRWAIQQQTLLTPSSSTLAPEAFMSAVIDVDGGQTQLNYHLRNGNVKIEGGDIFIYA
jgi:hypothetical protein